MACPKFFENPFEHLHSVTRGHDYGIRSSLSELSKPSQNDISLMRLFGWTIRTNNKTSSGHYISFASDGPSACVKEIPPEIYHNHSPEDTFMGKNSNSK